MDINLDYYKAFYYVAKYGSTSKASELLSISQPAISQTIKKIESKFGCKLFGRTGKGMKLTKEGVVLYNHVSTAFTELETGAAKVEKLSHYEVGEIVIGAGDTALYHFLIPRIKQFNEDYPHIKVSVISDTTPKLLDMLKEEEVDLAFVLTHMKNIDHFNMEQLRNFSDIFISSDVFSELKGREIEAQTLSEYPFITLSKGSSMRQHFEEWFETKQVSFEPEYIVSTTDLIILFVKSGLGIGIIPEEFAKEGISNGEIFKLDVAKMPPKRYLYVATNKNIPVSTLSQKFIDSINRSFETW